MPKPVEGLTKMCSRVNPYFLQGTYIGSVISLQSVEIFVVQRADGQIFAGTRGALVILEPERSEDSWTTTTVYGGS